MSKTGHFIRWFARILSAIFALIILAIFVGEVVSSDDLNPPGLDLVEILMGLFFFVTWVGFLVGWVHEVSGGSLILFGLVAFYATQYVDSGSFPSGLFFLYMLIPGLLYLVSARIHRRREGADNVLNL